MVTSGPLRNVTNPGGTTKSSSSPLKKHDLYDTTRVQMQRVRQEHARKQKYDYSHVFSKKSRLDLVRISCIIMGIEFAYAAETAFVSPILLGIGIEHRHMTLVWGLSPLLGFFVAPILGSFSDRCKASLGRRRPLILLLSCGILAGLLLVPHGEALGNYVQTTLFTGTVLSHNQNDTATHPVYTTPNYEDTDADENDEITVPINKWAVVFTILGTILLDFDADTCQTPSRAYLLDITVPEDQVKGLSTFTTMSGIGGFLGYAIGGINWSETSFGSALGGNVKTVFTLVAVIFVLCVVCTVTSFREIPLSLMEKDQLLRPLTLAAIIKEEAIMRKNGIIARGHGHGHGQTTQDLYFVKTVAIDIDEGSTVDGVTVGINGGTAVTSVFYEQPLSVTAAATAVTICGNNVVVGCDLIKPLSAASSAAAAAAAAASVQVREKQSLGKYLVSIVMMPKSLRLLCVTNFLCWVSHVCFCLYFTDFVGEVVFGGDPSTRNHFDRDYILYEEGVRFGCWGMSIYALSCAIYSTIIEYLIRVFGAKTVYIGGLLVFAAGMCVLAQWPTKVLVLCLSVTAGIVYATLFTMPYLIVAQYHAKSSFKTKKGINVPQQRIERGLGTDIAIIGSMVFVAQLTVSLAMGSLIAWIGSTSAVIYTSSVFSLFAAIAATQVLYMDL